MPWLIFNLLLKRTKTDAETGSLPLFIDLFQIVHISLLCLAVTCDRTGNTLTCNSRLINVALHRWLRSGTFPLCP